MSSASAMDRRRAAPMRCKPDSNCLMSCVSAPMAAASSRRETRRCNRKVRRRPPASPGFAPPGLPQASPRDCREQPEARGSSIPPDHAVGTAARRIRVIRARTPVSTSGRVRRGSSGCGLRYWSPAGRAELRIALPEKKSGASTIWYWRAAVVRVSPHAAPPWLRSQGPGRRWR